MRKLIGLALVLLLCALTACGGGSDGTNPEGSSSVGDASTSGEPAGNGQSYPSGEGTTRENPEDWTAYDCGDLEIALPDAYLDQLDVVTDPKDSGIEGYTILMDVREKASVEAAERDFGTSEDVGILFSFVCMDQGVYDQLKEADGHGIDFFAQDGETYYAQSRPGNLQFYRGKAIDKESEDWKNWEALGNLGESIQEDMVRRNGLTALKK